MHWKRPNTSVKPPITSVVLTLRGPKHHEPARPPCPQSSGTCRQGLVGSRGPRARREQPVLSLAGSGAEAQTGQRDRMGCRVFACDLLTVTWHYARGAIWVSTGQSSA